jgi:hypothetical protein
MGIAELITESAEIWYPSGAHVEQVQPFRQVALIEHHPVRGSHAPLVGPSA